MKLFRYLITAALLAALFVLVRPVSAECPDDPRCTILPPVSQEIGSVKSEGSLQFGSAGTTDLSPLDQIVPMPPPPQTSSISESSTEVGPPMFEGLSLPLRYQDPSDPTCGAQALGMALDGLSGSAPSSSSLWKFMESRGMTYDFGTGVEELAHAAQSFGYAGSLPFHNASLADLQAELVSGRPMVVSLGANGEGQPGHFVTLTGISADGAWISYNDPILGKVVLATREFMQLWGAQGNSGVRVAKEALATPDGELNIAPWVAMAAGVMALVSTTPLVLGRKGIGGMLDSGGASGGSTGNPPYPAPAGYKWKKKIVTKYKTVWVQDGWNYENRTVPRYEKQRVQVGTTMVYDKIPRYKTVRVQDGWKTVYDRVAQYKTLRYVKYYRTTKQKVKRYRYVRGRRTFAGYSYVTKRTPVYGTKKIFNGYKKVSKRVPNYVNKRVPDGFKIIETEVPKFEWKDVQVGWTMEKVRVPKMVQVRKPDGVEVRWELERLPPQEPKSTHTYAGDSIIEDPTPTPAPVETPPPTETPIPPGALGPTETPTVEQLLEAQLDQDRCAILNCVTLEQGTFIGDDPFVVDDSIGGGVPFPGIWGVIMGLVDLTNTIGGPHAYVEYVNNQEDNVVAQLRYSLDTDGKTIEQVGIQNESGQFLKVIVNVQNSDGTITQVGPEWVNSGSSTIDIYKSITNELGSEESIFIEEGRTGNVKVTIVANFNDPPILTGMEFAIPAEE